jgi:hypothetical protein
MVLLENVKNAKKKLELSDSKQDPPQLFAFIAKKFKKKMNANMSTTINGNLAWAPPPSDKIRGLLLR